jgi:hypothetical protein
MRYQNFVLRKPRDRTSAAVIPPPAQAETLRADAA